MLSRVADNLYWMSRYLERAEHTARLLDVSLYHLLGQKSEYALPRWKRLRDSLRIASFEGEADNDYSVTQSLTFDTNNAYSIISCISAARDNARQIRERISSEMWEQLNRLYLSIKSTNMADIWFSGVHGFLTAVKEGVQLFQGLTDSTMSHNEGWQFIQVGRYIERTWVTAALIDVHFLSLPLSSNGPTEEIMGIAQLDYLEWVGLLRSCSAFEAYRKVYTADIQPERIAEFLLLDSESPRSIHFSITLLQNALRAIARATNTRNSARVERLAGRLRASLDYDQIEDIMQDIHSYLENIQQQCTQIHKAIYQ
ncbi:MAG TPA: alpha-E domain-containing protein, partial [Ktedonobacteraceae bacterium]|nr:alpha-E domain-containing protein [Ktedonobacteraceae bacterium]